MKIKLLLAMAVCCVAGSIRNVQAQQPAAAPPSGQKTLAATMNIYAFPTTGQTAEQQSKDEAECYSFAAKNTGTDPFQLAKQSDQIKQQTEQAKKSTEGASQGAGAAGAVKGAAAGALIGGISGDAGDGAAYGAVAGVIAGRRRGKAAEQQAAAQVEQQGEKAQQATKEQMDNFKKAFSVCLEAKKYMVKF